jgi:hypothetical protein
VAIPPSIVQTELPTARHKRGSDLLILRNDELADELAEELDDGHRSSANREEAEVEPTLESLGIQRLERQAVTSIALFPA